MAFMAEAKVVLGFLAVLVLIGAADVAAQSTDCTTEIGSLVPCLNFVAGGDKKPSPACCNAFAKVVSTNASCLCLVLTGNSGFQINQTKALTLPTDCNVATPPISNCNTAAAPASLVAPVPSLLAGGPGSVPGTVPPPSTGANTNVGAAFAPSVVAIVSVAALVLMKTLS